MSGVILALRLLLLLQSLMILLLNLDLVVVAPSSIPRARCRGL